MQTLSVCSTKGGAGKTTLTTALAVAAADEGLRVALIDIDPQQTLQQWWTDRGEPDNPGLITWDTKLGVRFLPTAIERTAALGYELLIIDTPPAIMSIVELAVSEADFVLIPTRASPADVSGNRAIMEIVEEVGKPFAFVINSTEPRGDVYIAETQRVLKPVGRVLKSIIANRIAFRTAIGTGRSAAEVDKKKAGEEIAALWGEVKKQLRAEARKVA